MIQEYQIFCDGACKGNPGPSAIGGIAIVILNSYTKFWTKQDLLRGILPKESILFQFSESLPIGTNNQAEYQALIKSLELVRKTINIDVEKSSIQFFLDSQLVVEQINGNYKVKNNNIRPLFQKAEECIHLLRKKGVQVKINYISRDNNTIADYLANKTFN